jgi:DNA-binding beta-propeller fold protein YncE
MGSQIRLFQLVPALLVLGVAVSSCGLQARAPTASAKPTLAPSSMGALPSSWGLYVSDQIPNAYQRLDARTLADVQKEALQGWGGYPVASADGSTVAVIPYRQAVIKILDAATGTERDELHTSATYPVLAGLTADGSRLVVVDRPVAGGTTWHLLDTRSGRSLGRIHAAEHCCGVGDYFFVEPNGRRLYRFVTPGSGNRSTGPLTPTLVAYEFTTGNEVGRLSLGDVLAGGWVSERKVADEQVGMVWRPGVALSPDGSRLAVLYSGGTRLMMVDLLRFQLEKTSSLARPQSLFRWLLPVRPAYAKRAEGWQWNLQFAPNGRHLYAWGDELKVDDGGMPSSQGRGLRLIDPESGRILSETMAGTHLYRVVAAPDGSSIYVFGPRTFPADDSFVLRRVDGASLKVTAEREFVGMRQVLLLAGR